MHINLNISGMKRTIYILSMLLLLFGCNKDENKPESPGEDSLEPYIVSLIPKDTKPPYTESYYIHVNYTDLATAENRQLTLSGYPKMTVWYSPSGSGVVMAIQSVRFSDPATSEDLSISFDFNLNKDTTFNVCYANYFFSDPEKNVAGANIHFNKPVKNADPATYNMYLGINTATAYFKITYIGNNRLNGVFRTTWKEFSTRKSTFEVSGDFSIPDMRRLLK